jgi:uncharacterized membrane protein (DUF441 family)
MERAKLQKRVSFIAMLFEIGILFGIVLIVTGFMAPAFADESISVSCYKDAKSDLSVGSAVVFDVAVSAVSCNNLYYDCKGRCIGCYQDFDYVSNVCVDNGGNTFLK